MADTTAVWRQPAPLWDGQVESALHQLAATLRQQYSKPRQEAAKESDGGETVLQAATEQDRPHGTAKGDASLAGDDAHDACKLALPPEQQAALLAQRRAQQLQPACLRLVKDLLQRPGAGGTSGSKHD
jgi:hypothetical protein